MTAWLLLWWLGSFGHLGAQIPRGTNVPGFGNQRNTNPMDTVQRDVVVDTFKIFSYYARSFYREQAFSDSLLTNLTHQLDPARKRRYDYQNLGIDGSAAQPFVYREPFRQGFDVGLHQFDLYLMPADSFKFYRVERAFTNAEYDRGADQLNSTLKLQFSRNFAQGVNLSLNYRRVSQLGERVQLPHQQSRVTAFGVGMRFGDPQDRYRGFFTFTTNKVEQEDNGGITAEPFLQGQFASPSSGEVQSETANTTYRWSEYQYTHYFNLRAKPEPPAPATRSRSVRGPLGGRAEGDSIRLDSSARLRIAPPTDSIPPVRSPQAGGLAQLFNKQAFFLKHTAAYKTAEYKFAEENPDPAADMYRSFYVDDRGLRHFIRHNMLENHLALLTFKPKDRPRNRPKINRGLLELGIKHRLHLVDQEARDYTVNNLFLQARWHYLPTSFLRLETYGHLGLLDNIGDFRAEGKLSLDLGRIGMLEGAFINQLSEPPLIYRRLYVSQQEIWNNLLQKTLRSTIRVTYRNEALKFAVTGAYHLVDNLVYFDTLAQARQRDGTISVGQLMIEKDFQLGKLHLDNTVALQVSSADEVLRLPGIFAKHSLYFKDRWFNDVLDTRVGLDLRYTTAYFADTFNPLVGSFHLQNQQEIKLRPLVDVYLSLRVSKFRAYVKFENLRNLLVENPMDAEGNTLDRSYPENWQLIYPTPRYPYVNVSGLRIGIKWRFTD